MSDTATYILGLLGIPGVGRVAASRLVEHFSGPESLLECPREQLLLRLKGIARAADIAGEIEATLPERMAEARRRLGDLDAHEVQVITPLDEAWPPGIEDLDRADRPVILYAHGALETIARRKVAIFATPPLSEEAFTKSQAALRHVLRVDGVPVTGARSSFDTAVHSVCSSADHNVPSILVLGCGLGKLDVSFRSLASAVVRSRGVLLSPFDMEHGPFDHDDLERASIQAAISDVSLFIEPPSGSPEWGTLEWAVSAQRSVFLIGDAEAPQAVHRITGDTDLDWLEVAVALAGGER